MGDALPTHLTRGNGDPGTGGAHLSARNLEVTVASGDALDVRHFRVADRISGLFEASIVAVSPNPDIDFEAVVGLPMTFTAHGRQTRSWTGVCSHLQQLALEERGLSTYELVLVPSLWLATQRRNYRMFQQMSEIDIVVKLLGEWGIAPTIKLTGALKKRKYRVQYGESDYRFICRMLEEAGVSFYFDEGGGVVLDDSPEANAPRAPIPYRMSPTVADREHVTAVRVGRRIRPGKVTVRDHDPRRPPSFKLMASAAAGGGVEARLESFDYAPGAFVVESDKGESTPYADDKGKYRADEGEGARIVQKRLEAQRAGARTVSFETNVLDLAPGTVVSILDHPKSELAAGKPLLVVESAFSGNYAGEWAHACVAVSAESPYRPALATPKPRVTGVESATVVGPPGEEIHVDEMGRVRVHFHWDRESKMDDSSSCWIPVSQPWGGAGYGGSNLPRVGQEVIVDFLSGDPDRPVIIGRIYTGVQKTPYKLPEHKTKTVWKSQSTGGGGGHNEIMLEDANGRELILMKAQLDFTTSVNRDKILEIGNDSAMRVARDRGDSIGRDLMNEIGRDQSLKIGKDSRTMIGKDSQTMIGRDSSTLIGKDQTLAVGRDSATMIGRDMEILVGKDLTKNVGRSEREMTGQNRSITVGQRRTSEIGTVDSTSVGVKHVVKVSPPKGHKNVTSSTMTHEKIVLTTGAGATITMEGAEVRIEADAIKLTAKKFITAEAESEEISILAKTELGLRSQRNVVIQTVEGMVDVQAHGGDIMLTADQGIIMASIDLSSRSETALFNAQTVTVSGNEWIRIASKSTDVVGTDMATLTGKNVMALGRESTWVTATKYLLIQGELVDINP